MKKLKRWLLPAAAVVAGFPQHGNATWSFSSLVWLALCWAWSESKNATDAFDGAGEQCRKLGFVPLTTSQGFMNALLTWTDPLMRLLQAIVQERMKGIGRTHWQVGAWVPIAFDGSRSKTPRTRSNERAFCAAEEWSTHSDLTGRLFPFRDEDKLKGMSRWGARPGCRMALQRTEPGRAPQRLIRFDPSTQPMPPVN